METTQASVEQVTLTEILELATWDRPRTNDELHSFISQRESALGIK